MVGAGGHSDDGRGSLLDAGTCEADGINGSGCATSFGIGLGILTCIAFLWLSEAMPLAATALLMPLLATIMGVGDIKTALLPFADPLIFMFFGGFALASALSYQKIDLWIARKLITLGNGRFLPGILLFCCTAFLSMWMSNTATTAMMLPVALASFIKRDWSATKRATGCFFC